MLRVSRKHPQRDGKFVLKDLILNPLTKPSTLQQRQQQQAHQHVLFLTPQVRHEWNKNKLNGIF